MYKHSLLVLVAAGLITMGASFATAQDTMSNDQQAAPSHDGEHMHHGMDPAKRTQELTTKLKLTSDQQSKVQEILQSEKSQMQSLHQDSSMSQQDRRSKMMDIHKTSNSQIRTLLDSTQQKQWDEVQAKHKEHMQKHHGDSPDSNQGPPQQ